MVQVSVEGGICSSYSVLCFVRALGYRPYSRLTIWCVPSIPTIIRVDVAWNVEFNVRRDFYRSSSCRSRLAFSLRPGFSSNSCTFSVFIKAGEIYSIEFLKR